MSPKLGFKVTGITADDYPVIEVAPGGAFEDAGLVDGDVVVSVDGLGLLEFLQGGPRSAGGVLRVVYRRGDSTLRGNLVLEAPADAQPEPVEAPADAQPEPVEAPAAADRFAGMFGAAAPPEPVEGVDPFKGLFTAPAREPSSAALSGRVERSLLPPFGTMPRRWWFS
jgi:hypothetical protein